MDLFETTIFNIIKDNYEISHNSLFEFFNDIFSKTNSNIDNTQRPFLNILDHNEFAKTMHIAYNLLEIECLEFDNKGFEVSTNDKTSKGPGVLFTFTKTPMFMCNYIVYPVEYNTKTIYLKLLYMHTLYLIKELQDYNKFMNDPVINSIFPFGESIKELFYYGAKKEVSSDILIDKIILSQMPSFEDYYNTIMKNKDKQEIQLIVGLTHEKIINSLEKKSEVSFQTSILNNIINPNYEFTDTSIGDLSMYNNVLDKIQTEIVSGENDPFHRDPLNGSLIASFKYPISKGVYKEYNKDIINRLFRVITNYNEILKVISMYEYNNKLIITSKLKKNFIGLLKPFYFNICMLNHPDYKALYKVDNTIISNLPVKETSFPKEVVKGPGVPLNKYYSTWTLNQLNSINDKDKLFKLIIKSIWFNNKYIVKRIDSRVKDIIRGDQNDMYKYKLLNILYRNNKPPETDFDRGLFRYNELKKMGIFEVLTTSLKGPWVLLKGTPGPFNIVKSNITYLDFGGGIGDVTASIAKNEGYEKKNVFVTDIQNWLGKENIDENSKYITYRYLKTNDIPFENDKFMLITCLQVLHHIPNKDYAISQLYRVLNKDGILVIREHNCENIEDSMLIDIEHSLHAYVVDQQGEDYLQNYNDRYMSRKELEILMDKHKFKKINMVYPEDKGITKYYYSVWKKKEISWADIEEE